jgi:peroxiredoxin
MQRKLTLCLAAIIAGVISVHAEETHTHRTPQAIPASAQEVRPLLIGASVPDMALTSAAGNTFNLRKNLVKKPGIIIFYRGGWCPYCNRQLAQLQKIESSLLELAYQVLAISPDRPQNLAQSQKKLKPSYTLLSDSSMRVASAFGIAFHVDDATVEKYHGYGIDLEAASGEKHHLLPVPSVFIVGRDGMIGFTYVNPDYKVRIDSDVLLAAAKAVLKQ